MIAGAGHWVHAERPAEFLDRVRVLELRPGRLTQEARPGWIELDTTPSHGAERAGVAAGLLSKGPWDRSSDRLARPRVAVSRSIASARWISAMA